MFAAALLASCNSEYDYSNLSDKNITFKVDDVTASVYNNVAGRAAVESREGWQHVIQAEACGDKPMYLQSYVEAAASYTNPKGILKEDAGQEKESRAALTTENLTAFGLLAYRHASNSAITTPDFMYNVQVSKSGGTWLTNPEYEWPDNGDKLDFYAYAPYNGAGISLSSSSTTGEPTINFTMQTAADNQIDLITAKAVDRDNTNAASGVSLTFGHALTTVKFVKDANLTGTISSITIKGLYTTGTLTIGGSWSFTGAATNFSPAENTSYMMIPQTFGSSASLEVTYVEGSKTQKLVYSLNEVTWQAGQTITYTISSDGGTAEVNTAEIGDFVFSDGTWGSLAANPGKTPVAIIFLNVTTVTDQRAGYTHGYAMALKNVHSRGSTVGTYKWANSSTDESNLPNISDATWKSRRADLEGRTNTSFISTSSYPAGYAAKTTYASQVAAPSGTSGWFLPSSGQWYYILVNLGGMSATPGNAWGWSNMSSTAASNLNSKLSVVGSGNYDSFSNSSEYYWSSSEASSSYAYSARFYSDGNMAFASNYDKSNTYRVRAVLAF